MQEIGSSILPSPHNWYIVVDVKKFDCLYLFNVISDLRSKSINRHGAEEARGAHNSEDIGSKPIVGILVSIKFTAWY